MRRPPPPSARCRAVLLEVSQYLDGDVTPARCRAIERHLRDCACCGALTVHLQQTVAACRSTTPKPLPRDVRARAAKRIATLLRKAAIS